MAGNANLGVHLEATRDVNVTGHSITGLDYLKVQSGRNALLDTVSVGAGSANAGASISVNAVTSIQLAGNLTAAGGTLTLTGATVLADNVTLTATGNSGSISLGNINTNGGTARNLQLTSDSSITTGLIVLNGGTLTAQVDANNDGVASFTSTGAVTAGVIQIDGSAAKNDSAFAQGNLTSTVGAITLNNFNLAQLAGDASSNTDFNANNINTVELGAGADITSAGAINLDNTVTGVLLSGNSGSQNSLVATGTNAAVNLGPVTSTNNNVDLSITSDRGVSLKSITLTGGQVNVLFSQNNPANNSTANFTAAVTSDGLTVTGAGRTNDAVTFNGQLTLGGAGLSVTQVANTQVSGAVSTTTGNIAITSATATTLAVNLTTTGGSITLSGPTLLASNVVITKQGNTGSLSLGNVDTTSNSTRNLQLISDSSITTGSMNLHGGTLTAQVDANNDGVASFTSTGAVAAGVIQIDGSAAKNDSLNAQGNLTSTVGAITLNNFNLAQLSGDANSNTDFNANNINTVELRTGADITSAGAINLDSTVTGVLLSGNSNSQNRLVATGTNAAVNLGPVTSTNNNVDLSITSDRGVSLKSITLTGGQVDVLFSQNNPANNSTANFTAAVTSDGLTVTGAGRTNDAVNFNGQVTLGAAGLSVTQVAMPKCQVP